MCGNCGSRHLQDDDEDCKDYDYGESTYALDNIDDYGYLSCNLGP